MSHSSFNPDGASAQMLRELFKSQDAFKAAAEIPHGKLNKADEGVMAVAVAPENGKVVMHFAEPVAWIGFTPDQAMEFAQLLIKNARAIGLTKPAIITL